jgi:hypothetical protein
MFGEAEKEFDVTKFLITDKGTFAPFLRIQQALALMVVQSHIITAGEQVLKTLETIVSTTPGGYGYAENT